MQKLREIFQALSGGGFKGIEQNAIAKFVGQNMSAYKAADQSVTSSTTFVDDDTLFADVPLGPSKFEFEIAPTMAGAGGIKFSLVARNGLTISNIRGSAIFFIDSTAPIVVNITALGATATGGVAVGAWTRVRIIGSVLVTNPGVLQLQFAQDTSNGTATKILQGSTLITQQITSA